MLGTIDIETALRKAYCGKMLSSQEIERLLTSPGDEVTQLLCEAARALRQKYFGTQIFLYGFIYISTYCRNNCTFCYYRRANTKNQRYRKRMDEVIAAALNLKGSGVHLIDLTMGEDPYFLDDNERGFSHLIDLISSVSKETGLPIMISPGVVPDQVLGDLANAGATWYACYQETHSQKLFRKLRPDQDYTERLKRKFLAHDLGLLIEEGILLGIGERPSDLAKSIATMRLLEADQVRAMRFIPQTGTPMEHTSAAGPELEQRFIALLRLVFPDRLIPATLDVDGLAGLKQRLDAGANVITSLVPPKFGLAGVAQKCLDIENAHRTTHHVAKILADCGLHAATTDEYRQWIENQRIHRTHSSPKKAMPCALQ